MSVSISIAPRVVDAATEERRGTWWLVGGVAAELGDRLEASVTFIRVLLFIGMLLIPHALVLYAIAAFVVPHTDRRTPGWSNVIAVSRVGLFYLVVWLLPAASGGMVDNGGTVFSEGPAVWLPLAGGALLVFVVLLTSGRPSTLRDPQRDRSVALAILVALAGLGVVAGAIELVPSVRWEFAVGVLALLGGIALAVGGRRARALLVPVALLAACAVLLASSGVRLQGGIGDRSLQPLAVTSSHPTYRRAIGNLTIDLSAMRPHAGVVTITASLGIGDLNIAVPSGADTTASLHAGRGSLEALTCTRRLTSGTFLPRYVVNQTLAVSSTATQPGCGPALRHPLLRLRIVASVGIGTLTLTEPPWRTTGAG